MTGEGKVTAAVLHAISSTARCVLSAVDSRRCLAAVLAAVGVAASLHGQQRGEDESRAGSRKRLQSHLVEAAIEAVRISAWHEGNHLSPVISVDCGSDPEECIALLLDGPDRIGAGVWKALRLGTTVADGVRVGSSIDACDEDLERAVRLLSREPAIARLRDIDGLPSALIRRIAEKLPLPVTNPRADPAVVRRLERLERQHRLTQASAEEAQAIEEELDRIMERAESWKERYERAMGAVAELAADAEGRAIVAAVATQGLAAAGWLDWSGPAPGAWGEPAGARRRGSAQRQAPTRKPADRVVAMVQRAMVECAPCEQLAEVLLELESVRVVRVDSLFVTHDYELMLGRTASELSSKVIDRWRMACGLKRTARGWEGLPGKPRPRPSRIRDSPFGRGAP